MVAGIIALALTGVGLLLVLIGVGVSLADWRRSHGDLKAEGTAGDLEGLAKLADALRDYPLGLQLIFLGIACMFAGGAVGGIKAVI